jgi:hypothetical protein
MHFLTSFFFVAVKKVKMCHPEEHLCDEGSYKIAGSAAFSKDSSPLA